MMMSREQLSVWDGLVVDGVARTNNVVEVPGELVLQQGDLIDRILTIAFDVLGWETLEIRIRPQVECINMAL